MDAFKKKFLELVFPRHCLGCNIFMPEATSGYVCGKCSRDIPIKKEFSCAFCMAPVTLGATCPFCRRDYYLDRLLVTANYENRLVEEMVKKLKYEFIKTLAPNIAEVMARFWLKNISGNIRLKKWPPLIIPVPLYPARERWRGFNQSAEISSKLGEILGWPVAKNVIEKEKNTLPQTEVADQNSRIRNVVGAFSCHQPETISNQTVLLVDDVSTTGSTLNDCARSLKSSGAEEVVGFVFARNR